jgi:hypothetical protein
MFNPVDTGRSFRPKPGSQDIQMATACFFIPDVNMEGLEW